LKESLLARCGSIFDWPRQIQQLTTLGLAIGLPIVLVIAWYHGDRGERRVTRTELAILTMLFLLGGGLFWRYQHTIELRSTAAVASSTATTAAVSTVAATDRSIAVLPFDNMTRIRSRNISPMASRRSCSTSWPKCRSCESSRAPRRRARARRKHEATGSDVVKVREAGPRGHVRLAVRKEFDPDGPKPSTRLARRGNRASFRTGFRDRVSLDGRVIANR